MNTEIQWTVQTRKLSELKNWEKNPRKITEKDFARLKKRIVDNGFHDVLKVDTHGNVLSGNQRKRALESLGIEEVNVLVPSRELTEVERDSVILESNRNDGIWDYEILANNYDVNFLFDIGFKSGELGFMSSKTDKKEENELPDLKSTSPYKLGDIVLLGHHKIMCGDCTDEKQIELLMSGVKSELLFTSPPYSDMREYNGGKDLSVNHITKFISCFKSYCSYMAVNLGIQRKDNDVFEYWNEYIKLARSVGYKLLSWNIWDKMSAGSIGNQTAFFPIEHEFIFIFGEKFKHINRTQERHTNKRNKRSTHRNKDGTMGEHTVGIQEDFKEMGTVVQVHSEKTAVRKDHPAVFPVELPEAFINAMTSIGDIVTDCFLGSGSTLIASEKNGRVCYGMEIDPIYFDVCIRRWEAYTGKKSVKLN